jgi:diguanylate cyclase (GGDEF)-like protein
MRITDFERLSISTRLAAVGGSFALVSLIDHLAGPFVSTSLLYVLSVALATLGFGRAVGIVVSLAAAAVWLAVEVNNAAIDYSRWIHFWNAVVRFGFFLTIALLLDALNRRVEAEARNALSCSLTGLANGRGFRERLEAERQRATRTGRSLSLLYVDLDNFKAVNDRKGHAEGDRVLKAVADALTQETRVTDLAARLGGDEFALLLPETSEDGSDVMAHKLRGAVSRRMADGRWPVTLSIGAVTFTDPQPDSVSMLQQADAAMYEAKHRGKDAIVRRRVSATDLPTAPA